MSTQTKAQYEQVIATSREIFARKNKDYGTSWRIMRLPSITDQIFIKAKRIRTIEQKGDMRIDEGMESEFMGIVNYCVIALIQLEMGEGNEELLTSDQLLLKYDREIDTTYRLMDDKNSDYGEAWREMRVSTFTDMIMMRILRIRQIEDNNGQTIASEGVDANFRDILNYAVFALIRLNEVK